MKRSKVKTSSTERREERRSRDRRRNSYLPVGIGITGGVALASIAFLFFKYQAEEVVTGSADSYDTAIMKKLHEFDNPTVNKVMELVTHLGSHPAIGTAAGLTSLALIRKNRNADGWTLIVSTAGAMALNSVLKAIFARQRPKELVRQIKLPKTHSFPSGHSFLSAATYPIVAHHLVQHRSTMMQIVVLSLTGTTVLSVGFSRMYLGVHFPSDVLGGFAGGLGWLGLTSLTHTLIDKVEGGRERGRKRALPPSRAKR